MYNRTLWQDHVTDKSGLYIITEKGDGTFEIESAGTVMQQGTPQDQAHFNNIECGIMDAHTALLLLLNAVRRNCWNINDLTEDVDGIIEYQSGTVTLTNSQDYPFNNSEKSVALENPKNGVKYNVQVEVVSSDGNAGEIIVSDKLVNGFKLAFTGSANSVTVNYLVSGGYERVVPAGTNPGR